MTTEEKKSGARTALTGSSYRRAGYNRYSVISARSRHESSHYDRGFISARARTLADHGGPASVFQTITGHHRIPASRRQQPRSGPLIVVGLLHAQNYFCFDDRRYVDESARRSSRFGRSVIRVRKFRIVFNKKILRVI